MAATSEKKIPDIVSDVRTVLDEIGINDSNFLESEDQSNLDTVIESKIEDAIRHIYLVADEQFLVPEVETVNSVGAIPIGSDIITVSVDVPDGFLRLISASHAGWLHPVKEYIPESDSRFPMLKNKYTSGSYSRPKMSMETTVVTSGGTKSSKKQFVMYGLDDKKIGGGNIMYVKMPVATVAETITPVGGDTITIYKYVIADDCYRSIVYYIAGLTLLTYQDEHADSLLNMALTYVGAINTQQNQ